jgi:ParB family transcriptional regulator, chromosome partitioning protein
MPSQSRGLGKGLDALIPTGAGYNTEPVPAPSGALQVSVNSIIPNPRQPRTNFDPTELEELAASIREHGIIQPLIVSQEAGVPGYVLIAGERRLQAAKHAGLSKVPVLIRQTTDQERLELALIENIQRTDLNAIEEAIAYQQLVDEFGLAHEEIAGQVGKSRVAVTNTMRLLKLPNIVQSAIVENRITEGHARALLALETPQAQIAAMHTIISGGLNVRQTEELVRKFSGERPATRPKPASAPDIMALEERLRSNLGTKVDLKHGKEGKGTITLHFYSDEELNTLLDRLLES